MRSRLDRLVVAAAIATGSVAVQAAPPSLQAASNFTLVDLLTSARSYDPIYRQAVDQARATNVAAGEPDAKAMPVLAFSADANATRSISPSAETNSVWGDIGVQLSYSLYDRVNAVERTAASETRKQVQFDVLTADTELLSRVAHAFFDVLDARQAMVAARMNRDVVDRQAAAVQAMVASKESTRVDLEEVVARQDAATAQLLAAERDVADKRIALQGLVGGDVALPPELASTSPAPMLTLRPGERDVWLAQILDSPKVHHARIAQRLAELGIARARAESTPTLGLQLGDRYSRGRTTGLQHVILFGQDTGVLEPVRLIGAGRNPGISIVLNVPLYDGGVNNVHVVAAQAQKDASDDQLEGALRDARQAVNRAYSALENDIRSVEALSKAERSAGVAADAAAKGYRAGVRTLIDVLTTQNQLYAARRDLGQMRDHVLLDWLDLNVASGGANIQHLAFIDKLLQEAGTP